MMARPFKTLNIYVLLFKTRHLKPVSTRHQLQGSIVYRTTFANILTINYCLFELHHPNVKYYMLVVLLFFTPY